MKFIPFSSAHIDAVAQCPKCLRTWSYDAVDALLDWGNRKQVEGMATSGRVCPGCGTPAKLYQSLETVHTKRKA
jgi:hypothetical protein